MCLSATVVVLLFFLTKTIAKGDEHGDSLSNMYARATVNFNEIFTNSLSMLTDEPGLTSITKDEDYRLNNIPTEFVEFRQQKQEPTTTPTPPPPKYIRNTSLLKKDRDVEESSSVPTSTYSSSTHMNSSEAPEEKSVKVIPIKQNYQRGVLDLLFPASRVRTFKSIFDTFRKILSHTFRRR